MPLLFWLCGLVKVLAHTIFCSDRPLSKPRRGLEPASRTLTCSTRVTTHTRTLWRTSRCSRHRRSSIATVASTQASCMNVHERPQHRGPQHRPRPRPGPRVEVQLRQIGTPHLQQHTCSTPAAARQAGGALALTRSAHGQRCSRAASVPSRCVSGAGWADLMRQACSASALPGARELLAARQTEISYANLSSEVQASHRPETKILV